MAESIIDILFRLSLALILTILIEWGLSFLFLHSKTDRKLIILVQCLTNPALNVLLLVNEHYELLNQTILIVVLESCIVIIEAIIYKKAHISTKINIYLLSFFLNVASVCIGLLLSQFVGNLIGIYY